MNPLWSIIGTVPFLARGQIALQKIEECNLSLARPEHAEDWAQHLRNLLPVARSALAEARVKAEALDAVAATQGPLLPSALLVGLKAAQALAFSLDRPFLGVHHHEAHLYSPWISGEPAAADFSEFQPNVSLVVSGGHTMLVNVESLLQHRLLGATLDDAAGECFDKVEKALGPPLPCRDGH